MVCQQCEELKAVGDLQKWGGTDPAELGRLRETVHTQNLDLDLPSLERLRKAGQNPN
jgi:hypothetical protein